MRTAPSFHRQPVKETTPPGLLSINPYVMSILLLKNFFSIANFIFTVFITTMLITNFKPALSFKGSETEKVSTPKLVYPPITQSSAFHGGGGDLFIRQDSLDIVTLKALDIPHFRLIDSNSVRGMSLANKPAQILQSLKDAGIQTVIDLRKEGSYDSKYAKNCERLGINYFNFKLKENMAAFNMPGTTKLSSMEFTDMMEGFTKQLGYFFQLMEEGKVYMGCLLGLHRTDLAVVMNYLLNPKEPQSPPILSHMFYKEETNFTNKRIGAIKNLLRNINPEQRFKLHMPDNIQEVMASRITKLRLMNLTK